MIIYHTGEAFNFKKSKVIEVILKIVVGFLCALSLFYLNKTVSEVKQLIKYENSKDKNPYVGYYRFKPDSNFWIDANNKYSTGSFRDRPSEKLYAELVRGWQAKGDLKVERYYTYYFARQDRYAVLTYYVPESYTIDWEGIVLEMESGEWFQDQKASLIVLKGKDYKVGDKVEIKDKSGGKYWLPITGIAKDHYLVVSDAEYGIKWDDRYNGLIDLCDDIFLLNPFCVLNPPTDIMPFGTYYGSFKTNDYMIRKEIEYYGSLSPVKIVDSGWREIKRPEIVFTQNEDSPFWMTIGNYISVFHLWYIIPFVICYVAQYVLIYFLHQWNFAKRLWIYLSLGALFTSGFRWYTLLLFVAVLVYHIVLKKNTVHGRTYIVDGWDETDVDI